MRRGFVPQITVIVPVYNVEDYLRRCVESVLSQTYRDYELVLVEDGSPDNCGLICDEYAAKNHNIYVIHQENRGLSAARNAGIDWAIQNSDSQWITFIDSDDWVNCCYLEALYEAVINLNCNISMCLPSVKTKYEEMPEICFSFEEWSPEDAFSLKHTTPGYSYAWGRLYSKESFTSIRYPEGKICEDIYTTYKLIFNQEKIAVVKNNLYYYFDNPNGIVRSRWNPDRMDSIYAREELISFLNKNGYTWLHSQNVSLLGMILSSQFNSIKNETDSYRVYLKQIQKKLRVLLKAYPELFSIKKTPWVYEAAYPLFDRLYWKGRGLIKSVKLFK